MTDIQLCALRCGTESIAADTVRDLTRVYGFIEVEAVGPLVVWPSTREGADFSARIVASVARVMANLHQT